MIARSDWFILIFTFIVGMSSGAYLYITSFQPLYGTGDGIGGAERSASDFSVIGKSYGGSNPAGFAHPSFRITGDGSYSYLPGGVNADQIKEQNGELPNRLADELHSAVSDANLDQLSRSAQKDDCRIFSDGVDHTYRITVAGTQYELDTCNTALSYDHELALVLSDIWTYLEDGEVEYRNTSSSGADRSWLEEFLRGYFVRDDDDTNSGSDTNAPPPQNDEPVACTMEVKICPDGTAVGRQGPNCEFAPCPGEAR